MTNRSALESADLTEIAPNPSATPTPSYGDLVTQLLTVNDAIVSSRKSGHLPNRSPATTDPPPNPTNNNLRSPGPVRTHARNGKIARLPHAIREEVNQMLRNGVRYDSILKHLAELSQTAISKN